MKKVASRLPVAFDPAPKTEFYAAPKTGKQKRRSGVIKNERGRTLLPARLHSWPQFRCALDDSWHAWADNMKFIKRDLLPFPFA